MIIYKLKWLLTILGLAIYGTMGFLMLPWFLATPLTLVMVGTTRRPKKKIAKPEEVSLSGLTP